MPDTPDAAAPAPPDASAGMVLAIQALRPIAALAVAAYHARQWIDGGFDVGRAGVDVFFVISGVILWRVTEGRAVAPLAFLLRRLSRVAPLYWAASLVAAILAAAWPDLSAQFRWSWPHLGLSLLFVPHIDPRGLPFPILPPGWSLNDEVLFYLVFAAALAGPRAWRGRVLACGLIGLSAIGFAIHGAYFLGFNPMFLQFGVGVVLARATPRGAAGTASARKIWLLAGLSLIASGVSLLALSQPMGWFSELWRPLVWGAPAGMIVAGALCLETSALPMRLPEQARGMIQAAGDSAFAIYLVHVPIEALLTRAIPPAVGGAFVAASLAVTVVVAGLARVLIDGPAVRAVRRCLRAI